MCGALSTAVVRHVHSSVGLFLFQTRVVSTVVSDYLIDPYAIFIIPIFLVCVLINLSSIKLSNKKNYLIWYSKAPVLSYQLLCSYVQRKQCG